MRILKSLLVSSLLLSSFACLSAMQNNINKISVNNVNQYNINQNVLNASTINMSNLNPINSGINNNITQVTNDFLCYNWGNIWNSEIINNNIPNIEYEIQYKDFKSIVLDCHEKILPFITSGHIKERSSNDYTNISLEKYLKYIIKRDIISPKLSLEDQLITLSVDVDDRNENVVFDIIVEDYVDKYFINHPVNLDKLFNDRLPSSYMMHINQYYHQAIYEKLRLAFASLYDFEYFKNKYTKNEKYYKELISKCIYDKLDNAFQNYLIPFIEEKGWKAACNKYSVPNKFPPYYIEKRAVPQAFDDNIIQNYISIYNIKYCDLYNKYNDKYLQEDWEASIKGTLHNLFEEYLYSKYSIDDISKQFIDPKMQEYANKQYMEFFKHEIEYVIHNYVIHCKTLTLNQLLDKFKNDYNKVLASNIYNELIKTKYK